MRKSLFITLIATWMAVLPTFAQGLDAPVQAKLDAAKKNVESWAAEATIVNAVKAQNANPPVDHAAMTQDKWKATTVLDPFVRAFTKNAVAEVLKGKKTDAVSEAFVSDAKGNKVAFLAKTSAWCHKGKAKHDDPMAGKIWQGPVEVDESTGIQQVQVSAPVLDGGKPIGSLVVGFSLGKL